MTDPSTPRARSTPRLRSGRAVLASLGRAALSLLLLAFLVLALAPGALAQAPPPSDGSSGLRDGATMPGGGDPPAADGPASMPAEASAAQAQGRSGASNTAFFLFVALGLFGFHLFTTHGVNARIDRLEELLRRSGLGSRERDELVPFSWDAVLRSLEAGHPFLPGLSLSRPGLVLVGVASPDLEPLVLVNVARTVLADPELVVLAVTRRLGPDELGRRLLSVESGRDWRTLGSQERQALLQGTARELQRYERSLFCMSDLVLTPRQLSETCQELVKEGELGAILLDGLEVLAPEEDLPLGDLLDHLRLLAARCHVPVHLVVPTSSPVWEARRESGGFLAVAEVQPPADGAVRVLFHKFPGGLPECSLRLDPASGRLEAAAREGALK